MVFLLLVQTLLATLPSSAEVPPSLRFRRLGVDEGLSHTTVWDLQQDRRGFVWIATESSIQRYDGYELVSYQHDPDDLTSISDGEFNRIFEDRQGNLWFAGFDGVLERYDPAIDGFLHYPLRDTGQASPLSANILDLTDDREGRLWLATSAGLDRLDPATGTIDRFTHDEADPASLSSATAQVVLEDRQGNLWVGTTEGLDRLDPATGKLVHHRLAPASDAPFANSVTALYEGHDGTLWTALYEGGLYRYDRASDGFARVASLPRPVTTILGSLDGRLWISSYGGGLFRFDPATAELAGWRHDPDDRESLGSDDLVNLAFDRTGLLWVSTRDGISLLNPRRSLFTVLRHGGERGLGGRNVSALLEDRQGTIWIGTREGKLDAWSPARGTIEPLRSQQPTGSIRALVESRSGELWAGCELGLFRVDRAGHKLDRVEGSDRFGAILALAEDAQETLWLGGESLVPFTVTEGFGEPLETDPGRPGALAPDPIYALWLDRSGLLWAGGEGGLSQIDPATRQITSWRPDPAAPTSLPRPLVSDLYEDRTGRLWLGTYGGGLVLFDRSAGRSRVYRERDGLANDHVAGLLEDASGGLWVSTNLGLSRFDPEHDRFRNYGAADGLASSVFLIRSRLKSADGRLIFGGHNGLTAFSPAQLHDDPTVPPVVITELRVGGEVARPGAAGSPLTRAVSETRELVLGPGQRSFALTFAAPHFANPSKNRYAYRLEGYDTDWIHAAATDRRARYTNLDPGEYVFRVKASNADGVWGEEETTLELRVLPPLWKTWWAFALYAVALVSAIVGYDRWQERRLERERQVSQQLREVDRLKNEFLANTSHELRTPLFGITGLAESLLDGVHGELPQPVREDLTMMVASGRRLGGLVNDILDFSRLRSRELGLAVKAVSLGEVVELVLSLTLPLVGGKRVELINAVASDLPAVRADENRLQQILLNLVSNAIKFTERGRVEIAARVVGERVQVVVSDTGIGIAADQHERIFAPFEQVDASAERIAGGTGLGLAITRHLVELHGSQIALESMVGVGSRFSFELAIAGQRTLAAGMPSEAPRRPRTSPSGRIASRVIPRASPRPTMGGDAEGTILIVDDEPVVRHVLVNQLSQLGYRLLEAGSGPEALRLLEAQGPQLVLLDIMMPRMSGFEVCRQIRQTCSLEELPVIYLTAKSQVEDLVQGFSTGANDFLTKPIIKEELLARVKTHLELARLYRNLEQLVDERTAQVKILRGLLPICSSCKKIRDDHGYWNELEAFLSHHSEAQLTHALCLECARKLYPELTHDFE